MAEGSSAELPKVQTIYGEVKARKALKKVIKPPKFWGVVMLGEGVLCKCIDALNSNTPMVDIKLDYAIKKLEDLKPQNFEVKCLIANLKFWEIIDKRRRTIQQRTKPSPIWLEEKVPYSEAVHRKSYLHKIDTDENPTVHVPKIFEGYSVEEDEELTQNINAVLDLWHSCLINDFELDSTNLSVAFKTLRTLIICGEYFHLHKIRLETVAWILAYDLAKKLDQLTVLIYVTGRCLRARYIKDEWLKECQNLIRNNEQIVDSEVVAIFWLELADFYFDCKKIEEAKSLLLKVKQLKCYKYLEGTNDPVVFGFASDIEFRNYFSINQAGSQESYVELLVKIHYALRDFHDIVHNDDGHRYEEVEYKLLGMSTVFDILCNIIMPSISLVSFIEIQIHIIDWLYFTQQHGWTLRIADCLKYLCYIDLSRLKVEVCETKLDALEKILCIEKFEEWPLEINERKNPRTYPKYREKIELTKKLFRVPNCLSAASTPCYCFARTNVDYSYLLFAHAYIRAQLYCLVDYEDESAQHFRAAFLLRKETEQIFDLVQRRSHGNYSWKENTNYVVDYLMCMIDFALCLKKFTSDSNSDALEIFETVIEIASENDLGKHWIAVYATEMKFEHQIYNLPEKLYEAIFVPPPDLLDAQKEDDDEEEKVKGPITRSKAAKLALEEKMKGPMTRSKTAELQKAQTDGKKKKKP